MSIADAKANVVESWYLDIGCSIHMTCNKAWFCELDETVKKNIKFADCRSIRAKVIGKVEIKRSNGKRTVISNVLYVPGMKSNLLSLGQMLEKGYSVRMQNGYLELLNTKNKVVLKSLLSKNRTFKLEGEGFN